jgi:hypothetical protein
MPEEGYADINLKFSFYEIQDDLIHLFFVIPV